VWNLVSGWLGTIYGESRGRAARRPVGRLSRSAKRRFPQNGKHRDASPRVRPPAAEAACAFACGVVNRRALTNFIWAVCYLRCLRSRRPGRRRLSGSRSKADANHVQQFFVVGRLLKKCRGACLQCALFVVLGSRALSTMTGIPASASLFCSRSRTTKPSPTGRPRSR
jgi:hypothetical protein